MIVETEAISLMDNHKDTLPHCKFLWTFQGRRSQSQSLRRSIRRRQKMRLK